jgi:hypothetical protein
MGNYLEHNATNTSAGPCPTYQSNEIQPLARPKFRFSDAGEINPATRGA